MDHTSEKPEYLNIYCPKPFIAHVEVNRPAQLNAFLKATWTELSAVFDRLSRDPDVRVIILSGAGEKAFTAGIDVREAAEDGVLADRKHLDPGRLANIIRRDVKDVQHHISCVERCEKPVICILHGFSVGLAIDIASACDIRICTQDVKLSVREVDVGLAADLGTLNRLPRIVGNAGWVKEICMTGRTFGGDEALQSGFVTKMCPTKAEALNEAFRLADVLASKSPVAVQGTKELLNYSRDHGVDNSLRYTQAWNAAYIQSEDVKRAVLSGIQKRKPTFEKL